MRISEAAQATGISVFTLRYYEKQGLFSLTDQERDKNNYRNYSPESIITLKAIRKFRELGFTLAEIKAFYRNDNEGQLVCDDLISSIGNKIDVLKLTLSKLYSKQYVLINRV